MSLGYVLEKFSSCLYELAASDSRNPKYRAKQAFLSVYFIPPCEIPNSCQSAFVAFKTSATWCDPKGDEGSHEATLLISSEEQCTEMVKLFCKVHELLQREALNASYQAQAQAPGSEGR